MTAFARIFRTLTDAFPSSGAGPVAQPSSLSDEVSLVHEISHSIARLDERRIFQTVGNVGLNIVNITPDPVRAGRYLYVLGASTFHDDVAPRLLEFYAIDVSGTNLAYQLRSSRDFVPAGHAANEIFGMDRVFVLPPNFLFRVFCPGIGVAAKITGTICFIECPFQDLPAGP